MNIHILPAFIGGESWSSLGSSFEGSDPNIKFAISLNPMPALAAKDAEVEAAVADANDNMMVVDKEEWEESEENPSQGPGNRGRNRRQLAVDRLASLYRDPNFGPEYFRQNARLIKHLMLVYRTCKTTPNMDMFYHKGSTTGIHIHFNSATRKKQLVIPLGSPDADPVRINISDLISWYKAQRRKAITAALKAQLEIMELKLALAKAKEAMNVASSSLDNILGQFERFLEACLKKREDGLELKKDEERRKEKEDLDSLSEWASQCWDPRAAEIRTRKKELGQKTDELAKLHDDQRLYVEKDFLKLMLDGLHSVTNKFWSLARLIKEVFEGLVKCGCERKTTPAAGPDYDDDDRHEKEDDKGGRRGGGYNLRSRSGGVQDDVDKGGRRVIGGYNLRSRSGIADHWKTENSGS